MATPCFCASVHFLLMFKAREWWSFCFDPPDRPQSGGMPNHSPDFADRGQRLEATQEVSAIRCADRPGLLVHDRDLEGSMLGA